MKTDFQEKVFERLKQTNYEIFDGNVKDASDFIAGNLLAIIEYKNVEARATITAPIEKARGNAEILVQMKNTRENAFNSALNGIKKLNALCKNLGMDDFMPDFDENDTAAVKKAIGEYTDTLFEMGINKK